MPPRLPLKIRSCFLKSTRKHEKHKASRLMNISRNPKLLNFNVFKVLLFINVRKKDSLHYFKLPRRKLLRFRPPEKFFKKVLRSCIISKYLTASLILIINVTYVFLLTNFNTKFFFYFNIR